MQGDFQICISVPLTNDLQTKEVAFADDLTVAGKLANFQHKLAVIGPKYGYFPKSTKSYLIVNKNCLKDAKTIFTDTNINITTIGRKHLKLQSSVYRRPCR